MMLPLKSISIDVTYRCNLMCRHCFNESNRVDPREMSDEMLLSLAEFVGKARVPSVCICGGEPLCRIESVLGVVSRIKHGDQEKVVSMVSNGLLWTEERAKALKSAGLDAVQFSLDGLSDYSYDIVRDSGGRLNKVLEAIEMARDHGFRVMIACLPHKYNLSEIDDILRYCDTHGVEELRFQPLMPLGRGEDSFDDLKLSDSEYALLQDKIKKYEPANPRFSLEWGDPIDHFFMLQEIEYVPQLTINAYGEILATPYLPITIWDLRKRSF